MIGESMKGVILIVIVLAVSTQAACRKAISTSSAHPAFAKSPCEDWQDAELSLSPDERETLEREGAIRKVGHFILSKTLVSDCALRGEMSSYFFEVLFTSDKDARDKDFAAQHSKEIVSVLRHLWPSLSNSKALIGDGDFGNLKYALLADPAFDESDIAPLISGILETETIDNALARILFLRPMPGVVPALLNLQKKAEEKNDTKWQILNLALLQKTGYPAALTRMKSLSKNKHLSNYERNLIRTLIAKVERGEELKFSDVEDLEYSENR